MPAAANLATNAQAFGKYQLLKKLATGGMAEVWLARQTGIEGFQRLLVVKRILPHLADDPEFVQMFLNEAKIAARFSHANIAQIFDLGEMNGTYFIAMEFVHGEDMGRVMRKAWSSGQWIARPLSIRIVASACEGLHYAHMKTDDSGRPLRVVHRDISPQNILVSFDGSVKLVDFGIAKAADQASLTKSGAIKGKFAYMSPEQAAGKPLDHRSDIFSIGLVLYELLTGVRPLKRDSELATLQAALECNIEPPSKVADVPEELDSVVMRALAKAADDRYRDARSFQMALEEFLVAQRWVASSVQLSELMSTLFADRLAEEAKLGHPDPQTQDTSAPSGSPMPPLPDGTDRGSVQTQRPEASKEPSWDAPPGEAPSRSARGRHQPRTMSRGSQISTEPVRRPVRAATPPPPEESAPAPDMPEWEAPPAAAPPKTRSRELQSLNGRPPGKAEATAIARSNSKPEMQSVRRSPSSESVKRPPKLIIPSGDERDEEEAPSDAPPPRASNPADVTRQKRKSSIAAAVAEAPRAAIEMSGELTLPPDDVEPPRAAPSAPRRTSSGVMRSKPLDPNAPRRTSSKPVSVPEVITPGRARLGRGAVEPIDEVEDDDIELPISPEPRRAKRATPSPEPRFKIPLPVKLPQSVPLRPVLGGVGALILVIFLLAFHSEIGQVLNSKPGDGQAVYLSVDSNLPVIVSIRHHAGEAVPEPVQELGEVPLTHVPGAHVRDTLIMKLESQDVYYEQEIPYGEPGQTIGISKEFQRGYYVLNLKPDSLKNLSVRLNSTAGAEVARYPPASKIELVQGRHTLVLVGDQLVKPVELDAEVDPGKTTQGRLYNLQEHMKH